MESLKYVGYRTHLNAAEHKLTLNADGSCQAETVLDPSDPSPTGSGTWVSPSIPCRWQLADGKHQTLDVLLSLDQNTPRHLTHLTFYFDQERGTLVLWQYVTDPDAWKYMEFKKSAEPG